jgi:hypothetical protein
MGAEAAGRLKRLTPAVRARAMTDLCMLNSLMVRFVGPA